MGVRGAPTIILLSEGVLISSVCMRSCCQCMVLLRPCRLTAIGCITLCRIVVTMAAASSQRSSLRPELTTEAIMIIANDTADEEEEEDGHDELTEFETWERRHEKRMQAYMAVLRSADYEALAQHGLESLGPNPLARLAKRPWEKSMQRWRNNLAKRRDMFDA